MIPKIECAKLTGSLTPIHFQFVYERIRRKAIIERTMTNIMNDKCVMYQILLPSNFFLGNRNLKYLAINIPVVAKNIQENIIIIPWDFAFAKDFSSPALICLSTACMQLQHTFEFKNTKYKYNEIALRSRLKLFIKVQ